MDHIRLREIIVYGYYGASDPERQVGQRLLVDLDLGVDLSRAAETDDLSDTVSYEEIYVAVQQLAGGTRCRLLEHLAQTVIDGLFRSFPPLTTVGISLRKMNLPFPNTCREVEVLMTRERPE
jgi:7,8-dihydroneopterin aldolase/epimerase/oxygenase